MTFEQRVDEVLAEMKVIMLDRQEKYGPENITAGGVHGLIIRMQDKLARIRTDHKDCRLWGDCVVRELDDEAPLDAWLDMANYAGPIGVMVQRGKW